MNHKKGHKKTLFLRGDKVRLIRFNGCAKAPRGAAAEENYWRLIGKEAEVVAFPSDPHLVADHLRLPAHMKGRVCVKFPFDVEKMGLECHNDISFGPWAENALWVAEGDIERLAPIAKR